MAHLRAGICALAAACASCHGASEMGVVELDLYDRAVECTEAGCFDADGELVEPLVVRSWAFMSTQTSQYHPEGRYLLFQVSHPDGGTGTVEIDVSEEVRGRAEITYVERVGDTVTFEARGAEGAIELPRDALGEECTCTDARFDLVFESAGADGELGTADDAIRRLARGRLSLDDGFCVERTPAVEPGGLDVRIVDRCPPWREPTTETPTRPVERDPYEGSASGGCEADSGTSSDAAGCDCESDTSGCDDGGSSSSGSGCEGDSSSSGSGCEGDSSSSGSGCEGDSSSSGSACEGDARDDYPRHAGESARPCRVRRASVLGGPLQTPLLVGLVLFYVRMRARR